MAAADVLVAAVPSVGIPAGTGSVSDRLADGAGHHTRQGFGWAPDTRFAGGYSEPQPMVDGSAGVVQGSRRHRAAEGRLRAFAEASSLAVRPPEGLR